MRKDFYLHRRGEIWYAQFYRADGSLAPARSSRLKNETAAEKWARKESEKLLARRTDLLFGEWARDFWGPSCPRTRRLEDEGRKFSQYAQGIRRGYRERYIDPDKVLAAVPLADLRRADLLAFRARLVKARGVCRSSQIVMGLVRIILHEALEQELIDRDPSTATTIKRYPKKRRLAVDAQTLRSVLEERRYSRRMFWEATLVAGATGMRAGEVRGLRWGDFDFKAKALALGRTFRGDTAEVGPLKHREVGDTRNLPLPAVLVSTLKPRAGEAGDWAFSLVRGEPMGYRLWAQDFRNVAKKAAPGLTLHGLRHSLNTLLREEGVPDEKLRAWFGWTDHSIQGNYTHSDLYDLREVARAIDRLLKGGKRGKAAGH